MHARLALGMSQRAAGALASLSADKVWKIENNRAPALSLRDAAQLGAVLGLDPSARTAVELEARLEDLQAMTRRHALKRRDDPVDNFLLVIADTVHNRRVLAEYGGLLPDLPRLRTAAVLALLEAGQHPPTGYIFFRAPAVPRAKTAPDAALTAVSARPFPSNADLPTNAAPDAANEPDSA